MENSVKVKKHTLDKNATFYKKKVLTIHIFQSAKDQIALLYRVYCHKTDIKEFIFKVYFLHLLHHRQQVLF